MIDHLPKETILADWHASLVLKKGGYLVDHPTWQLVGKLSNIILYYIYMYIYIYIYIILQYIITLYIPLLWDNPTNWGFIRQACSPPPQDDPWDDSIVLHRRRVTATKLEDGLPSPMTCHFYGW